MLKKLLNIDNLSLLLIATPGSLSLAGLLSRVVEDTPMKGLVLPLMVVAVSLSMYFVVFAMDFISGIRASRHEAEDKKNYFTSKKGWNSIWKLATVSVLVIWSSFFSMLAAIGGIIFLPDFFMFVTGIIAIMATLLDIYSIGENQKRITGRKSRIFDWLEQVMNLFNQGIIERIKKIGKPP